MSSEVKDFRSSGTGVIGYWTCVWETEFESSARAVYALNYKTLSRTPPFRSLFWVGGASEWPQTCYVGIHSRLLSPNDLHISTFPLFRSQECRHHAQLFILMCFKVIQFLCMQDKYFTNGKISMGLSEVGGWDRV